MCQTHVSIKLRGRVWHGQVIRFAQPSRRRASCIPPPTETCASRIASRIWLMRLSKFRAVCGKVTTPGSGEGGRAHGKGVGEFYERSGATGEDAGGNHRVWHGLWESRGGSEVYKFTRNLLRQEGSALCSSRDDGTRTVGR